MTALPHTEDGAVAPFTVADYAALGEDDDRTQARYELREGSLVMSPSPTPDHSAAVVELVGQIRGQLPSHLELLVEIDVDLDQLG